MVQVCLLWVLVMLALPVSADIPCAAHVHAPAAQAVDFFSLHTDRAGIPAGPLTAPFVPAAQDSAYAPFHPSHTPCTDHGHAQCTACCAALLAVPPAVARQNPPQAWQPQRFPGFAGRHPPPETRPPASFPS